MSGTIDIGLWYPRGTHIDLTCYSDADFADFAGYKVDRKSTSETCHFLGHSLVSWFSVVNFTSIAMVSLCKCTQQVIK